MNPFGFADRISAPHRGNFGLTLSAVVLALALPVQASAAATCDIIAEPALYQERVQQAILLTQYETTILRATDGSIRCEEDRRNRRLVCRVDGRAELLADTEQGLFVIRLPGDAQAEIHVSAAGDLSCGTASELESNRKH